MSNELPESDIVFARVHDQTDKILRRDPLFTIASDEQTIPDASERKLTTADVIRSMTATFRHRRS